VVPHGFLLCRGGAERCRPGREGRRPGSQITTTLARRLPRTLRHRPAGGGAARATSPRPSSWRPQGVSTLADRPPSPFTAAERELIQREMSMRFGQHPSLADVLFLHIWRVPSAPASSSMIRHRIASPACDPQPWTWHPLGSGRSLRARLAESTAALSRFGLYPRPIRPPPAANLCPQGEAGTAWTLPVRVWTLPAPLRVIPWTLPATLIA
jgi:hypothetical protein